MKKLRHISYIQPNIVNLEKRMTKIWTLDEREIIITNFNSDVKEKDELSIRSNLDRPMRDR
jgi:hypothetical protein